MSTRVETSLPDGPTAFLDGSEIETRVGETILLVTASSDGWPLVSLLSVGEVLAVSGSDIRLLVHAHSRSVDALRRGRRGLLVLVVGGAVYKIRVRCEEFSSSGTSTVAFRALVDAVEIDVVPYANVLHGIVYDLVDREGTLSRWREQLEDLEHGGRGD